MSSASVTILAFEFIPYHGGIAHYSHALAKYLYQHGHSVRVITTNHLSLQDGYKLSKPNRFNSSITLINKFFSFIFRLNQYVFLVRQLIKILLSARSSRIIVTSLFVDFSLYSIQLLSFFGKPYEVVLHGLDIYQLSNQRPNFLKKIVNQASNIIVNSKHTGELLWSKLNEQSYHLFPPLLDLDKIDQHVREITNQKEILNDHQNIILSVCRLVPRKGIHIAIRSIIPFLDKHQEWSYLIAGDGPMRGELEQLIPASLKSRIILLGPITEHDKVRLLINSSIYIMPNLEYDNNDVEGFGISFIEASYFKNWVIGGNNGGVPEAIGNTTNGYLIDMKGDPEGQILEALNDVMSRDDSAPILEKAKQRVIKKFSFESEWDI